MYKVGLRELALVVEDATFTQLASSGVLLGGHSSFHLIFHYPYITPYYPNFIPWNSPKGEIRPVPHLLLGGAGFRVHEAVR